jgi:hypothetical protein
MECKKCFQHKGRGLQKYKTEPSGQDLPAEKK